MPTTGTLGDALDVGDVVAPFVQLQILQLFLLRVGHGHGRQYHCHHPGGGGGGCLAKADGEKRKCGKCAEVMRSIESKKENLCDRMQKNSKIMIVQKYLKNAVKCGSHDLPGNTENGTGNSVKTKKKYFERLFLLKWTTRL